MTNTADNNRVKLADRLARIETKLDAVHRAVEKQSAHYDAQLESHSKRLDSLGLAIAKLEQGERERDTLRKDVESLKKEQRWWTGVTTLLATIAGILGLRQ